MSAYEVFRSDDMNQKLKNYVPNFYSSASSSSKISKSTSKHSVSSSVYGLSIQDKQIKIKKKKNKSDI